MRTSLLSLLLFMPCLLFAQAKHIVIEGTVTDVLHKPIAYATIQNTKTIEGTNADTYGHYYFTTTPPAMLQASFIGYKTVTQEISPLTGKDTLHIDFVLRVDSIPIKQVEISSAPSAPQLIKESGSLIDFDINENKIWLLNKYRDGDHLEVYDTSMKYLTRVVLKRHSENLNKTKFHYLYTENPDSVRLFDYDSTNNSINIGYEPLYEYKLFLPVKAYNYPYYYYEKKLAFNVAEIYWSYDARIKRQKVFYSSSSEKLLRQNIDNEDEVLNLKEEISDLIHDGIPSATSYKQLTKAFKQVNDDVRNIRGLAALQLIIQTQIEVIKDSIYIFNFTNDTCIVFDNQNNFKRTFPILFDNKKSAVTKKEIITDENQKECYLKYELYGTMYLQNIDLGSGKPLRLYSLKFPFIEKLRVCEGYAYYTYSDSKENQMFTRHLYKQKLY